MSKQNNSQNIERQRRGGSSPAFMGVSMLAVVTICTLALFGAAVYSIFWSVSTVWQTSGLTIEVQQSDVIVARPSITDALRAQITIATATPQGAAANQSSDKSVVANPQSLAMQDTDTTRVESVPIHENSPESADQQQVTEQSDNNTDTTLPSEATEQTQTDAANTTTQSADTSKNEATTNNTGNTDTSPVAEEVAQANSAESDKSDTEAPVTSNRIASSDEALAQRAKNQQQADTQSSTSSDETKANSATNNATTNTDPQVNTAPPSETQAVDTDQVATSDAGKMGLQNGDFETFRARKSKGEPKIWRNKYPEQIGNHWQMKMISEAKSGRAKVLSSPTFGQVTIDLYGNDGRVSNYAYGGGNSQVVMSQYGFDVVFRQNVRAEVGRKYRFKGQIVSFYKGTGHAATPDKIFKQIGIDPTGGEDYESNTVIWGERIDTDHKWIDPAIEATAESDTITVFIRIENTEENVGSADLNIVHIDKFTLEVAE